METKRFHYLLVVLTICSSLATVSEARPRVTVSEGKLAGDWMRTRGGRRIAAFKGIPYAAPPVKDLRFQSPEPVKPWEGTRQATVDGNKCVQHNHFLGIYGEEDCLFLNVYSPNITTNNKLPVIVFIHGGAFHSGSSDSSMYGPDYLLDQDIVLVTMNYRLGIFGFLTFEDNILPGNLGLKDQRVALWWVRDNIAKFGGDPNKVTLFGESAGAASVHYHMLFNSDQGLFRAGICHSGSAFTAGSFQRPGDQKPLVAHLLNQTNCQHENSSVIIECLQKIRPYKLLRNAISHFPPFDSLMRNIELSPVLEPECVEDAFITSLPWNKSSSMPMIIGTNKYEALFIIADLLKDETNETFEKFDKDYKNLIPYNLMFETSTEDPVSVAKELREFYLQDNKIDREHVLHLANLISDGIFNYGTTEAVKNNINKTYLYSFNYHGSKSILNLFRLENNYGPTHIDELFFFFPILRQRIQDRTKIEDDTLISKQLIEIWTNFASHLQPTLENSEIEWEPVSTSDMEYLSINGHGNLTMDTYFYKDRMDFWANLPFRNKPLTDSLNCEREE